MLSDASTRKWNESIKLSHQYFRFKGKKNRSYYFHQVLRSPEDTYANGQDSNYIIPCENGW